MTSRKKHYRGTDRKALQTMLRDRGFYSTEGRLGLLSLLKKAPHPLSVPLIARRLGRQLDEVNVYRALEALTAAGILSRSDVRRGGAHYEVAGGHHHHIVCNECGVTEDVEICAGSGIEMMALEDSRGFKSITTHALEFFGTCRSCAT